MASDCIFCKIAARQIPSHRLHDDRHVLAFLDIHPLARGHALVIPKKHYVRLEDVPAEEASALMNAVQTVSSRLTRSLGATATTIGVNNGKDAGQEVPHVHVHIVPRRTGDGAGPIHALFRSRPDVKPDELAKLAEEVRGMSRSGA